MMQLKIQIIKQKNTIMRIFQNHFKMIMIIIRKNVNL